MKEISLQDKAKSYSRQKHRLAITSLVLPPVILFTFLILGLPSYFKGVALSMAPNSYVSLTIFFVFVGTAYYMVNLPLGYYSGFLLERKYNLSNQTAKDWFKREIKKMALSFFISLPIILLVYVFMRYWPPQWWLFTAISWFSISVILTKFAPLLIVPLFYKYSPIKRPALKDKLTRLALKAGFSAEGVYEINISRDTKKANAAVMGMGKQKRIVLCDTLLQSFSEPEIETVMAHELGHHKKQHSLKLVIFEGIFILITFFITNILFLEFHGIFWPTLFFYDFESFVFIYAIIATLNIATQPLYNAFSRKLEKDADQFALEITGDKDTFISAMKKLAGQNLADIAPCKFYEIILYSHPPISRRISFAESFGNKK
ncbi:MAG: M48 family metallopeptidase [Candidatus Omnitrophota bacterium]